MQELHSVQKKKKKTNAAGVRTPGCRNYSPRLRTKTSVKDCHMSKVPSAKPRVGQRI